MTTLSDLMQYYKFDRVNPYQINLSPGESGEHHIALRFSVDPDGVGLEAFRCTVYLHDQLYTKSATFNMTKKDIKDHPVWAWLKNRYEVRNEKLIAMLSLNNLDRKWPWWFKLSENLAHFDIMSRLDGKKQGSIIFSTAAPMAEDLEFSYSVQFTEDGLQYGKNIWELDNYDSVNIAKIKDIIERRLRGLPEFVDSFYFLLYKSTTENN